MYDDIWNKAVYMCCEYTENELQRQLTAVIILILLVEFS